MGAAIVFPWLTDDNSNSLSSSILPEWPHPRTITITIEHARAIDRDIWHLDSVMARARDVATISAIVSTICGAEVRAARAIGIWLSTARSVTPR
jgi:hypothetical protein